MTNASSCRGQKILLPSLAGALASSFEGSNSHLDFLSSLPSSVFLKCGQVNPQIFPGSSQQNQGDTDSGHLGCPLVAASSHCLLPVRIQLKAVLHFIIFMGVSTRDNIFFVLFTTKLESFPSSLVTIQCRTGQSPASYKDGENEAGIKWGNNIHCLLSALLCLN